MGLELSDSAGPLAGEGEVGKCGRREESRAQSMRKVRGCPGLPAPKLPALEEWETWQSRKRAEGGKSLCNLKGGRPRDS